MRDLIDELDQTRRAVAAGQLNSKTAHIVELRRRLRAPVADVWDACTSAERVPRWFLPLSGDLRPGGRYQLEGNAGGRITACEPPHRLQLTWEFGDLEPSLVTLELARAGEDTTELVLRHTVPDDDHWAQFGPGATGVGWDLALVGLSAHLAGEDLPGDEQFLADPRTAAALRRSATAWGAAHEAAGADPETARAMAGRTSAFYAPEEDSVR